MGQRSGCDFVHLVQGNQCPLSSWVKYAPGTLSSVAVHSPTGPSVWALGGLRSKRSGVTEFKMAMGV